MSTIGTGNNSSTNFFGSDTIILEYLLQLIDIDLRRLNLRKRKYYDLINTLNKIEVVYEIKEIVGLQKNEIINLLSYKEFKNLYIFTNNKCQYLRDDLCMLIFLERLLKLYKPILINSNFDFKNIEREIEDLRYKINTINSGTFMLNFVESINDKEFNLDVRLKSIHIDTINKNLEATFIFNNSEALESVTDNNVTEFRNILKSFTKEITEYLNNNSLNKLIPLMSLRKKLGYNGNNGFQSFLNGYLHKRFNGIDVEMFIQTYKTMQINLMDQFGNKYILHHSTKISLDDMNLYYTDKKHMRISLANYITLPQSNIDTLIYNYKLYREALDGKNKEVLINNMEHSLNGIFTEEELLDFGNKFNSDIDSGEEELDELEEEDGN